MTKVIGNNSCSLATDHTDLSEILLFFFSNFSLLESQYFVEKRLGLR